MRISILFLLFTITTYAQSTGKKGYFLNEKGETIFKQTFEQKAKTGDYTWITYETKDSLNTRLIIREEYGELTSKQKESLLENLKKVTGATVHENQTIIINFAFKESIPNQKHCLDYYSSIKSYRNFFKNKEQFAQFYITQRGFKYTKKFVFEDKDDAIRKMFFPYGSYCNYIIIKPDRRYYRQMSEHRQDEIPIKALADW